MDWACEYALSRYLDEVGDPAKCVEAGSAVGVTGLIFKAVKPLSILRYVNHHQKLRYRLSNVRHDDVVSDGEVDISLLVDHVSTGAYSSAAKKQALERLIAGHVGSKHDSLQLTNGHDFFALLGIALRDKLGKRLPPQSWRSEVQIHFRLAYSDQDFIRSGVFNAIIAWEKENPPYVILKPHLSS
jgi:hypothetical protein